MSARARKPKVDSSERQVAKAAQHDSEESARIAELHDYQILDTPDESHFDEIAKIAAAFFEVPIAVISFVDSERQWFKAKVGIEATGSPRDISFCTHTIKSDEVMVISDAHLDLRFAKNPLVTNDPRIRFYAGAPLITANQRRLGTICVIDTKPRVLNAAQKEMLALLSRQVVSQLELKKMGQELRQKNRELEDARNVMKTATQFLSQITDNLPTGVVCKDGKNDFAVVLWNKLMADQTGLQAGAVLGKTDYQVLPKNIADGFRVHDQAVLKQGRAIDLPDHEVIQPDGRRIFLHSRMVPLRNIHGEFQYVLSVNEDVTAKKEAQVQMIQSSKMSSLGEMATGIAHEINNPLAVIRAKAQILKDLVERDKLTPAAILACAEKIDETTVRISKIISGLRSFARDGGHDPFRKTSLQELIEGATDLCIYNMRAKGVKFEPPKLDINLQVECRGVQIVQVLLNLLNNSIDAITKLPSKWIRLEVVELEKAIEFAVVDSGNGITADVQDRMMQPFFTTKEVGKGTGLGLSISKGIVESHQGEFYYDQKSPNTKFVFRLPKSQTQASKKSK